MTINLNSSRSSSFTAAILTIVTATLFSVVTGCGAAPKMLPNPVRSSTPTTPTTATTPATPVFEPHLSAVAFNPTTNKLYVADSFLNTITVFDGPTNKILSTITVGDFPVSVAVNPLTNIVYVVNFDDQSMSVINGATNTVTATLNSLGINPAAVAVNPVTNKVYITNDVGETYDNVRVLDGASNTVITSMSVGGLGAIDLAINTKTNTIYVTTGISLAVISGTSDTVQTTLGTVQQSYSDDPVFFGALGVGVEQPYRSERRIAQRSSEHRSGSNFDWKWVEQCCGKPADTCRVRRHGCFQ
jgi:YVTN family beta-propeller protein